ncbi:MAG: hypothetical protein HYS38_05925 [Acidobacteria bacterium]|nr:hypothetical protein [Acidobacteriota bacterium]
MNEVLVEVQELVQMRDNIRRHVDALELCWSCQRISECEQAVVDDGAPVWLCCQCREHVQLRQQAAPGSPVWPSV